MMTGVDQVTTMVMGTDTPTPMNRIMGEGILGRGGGGILDIIIEEMIFENTRDHGEVSIHNQVWVFKA